jgi:hypothetical protein
MAARSARVVSLSRRSNNTDGAIAVRFPFSVHLHQEPQMKLSRSLLTFIAITAPMAMSAHAATDEQHDSHHPVTAAVAQGKAGSSEQPMAGKPGSSEQAMPGMAGMKDQMKTMHEMHEKMMAANSPEERNSLMAEHGKVMQEGMAMMKRVNRGAMPGMQGGGGMPSAQGDMVTRPEMMEQRMDMMQSMMQMMMDRMAPAPAAK